MTNPIDLYQHNLSNILFINNNISNHQDFVQPILELYKGKLFSNLLKSFSQDCINKFGTHIFSIKKSYSRTLTNILSSWMFSLYIKYDYSSDYFFPSNYNNTLLLDNTLRDLCKYNLKIVNIDEKIKYITTNLINNYGFLLDELENYKKSLLYKNNKNNYKIQNILINLKKQNDNMFSHTGPTHNILFNKFEISLPFQIKDKRLQNTINNILIPNKIYNKLYNNYTGPVNKMDEYIWAIIFRYQLLGSNNHQLAVLPSVMFKMKQDYNLDFECFASAINSTFTNYCSIYYDLEKYFGSIGSFFNIIPCKGTFGFNPPYQKDIIEIGVTNLFHYLDTTIHQLTFIITIPIWDNIGRQIMKELYNNELEKQNIDYGDFEIVNEIKKSKYFKGLRMIPKEKFTYIDHNFELYKNKTIQNTYVIILSNNGVSPTCNTSELNLDYLMNYNFDI
jgi:hypothetical protein